MTRLFKIFKIFFGGRGGGSRPPSVLKWLCDWIYIRIGCNNDIRLESIHL